MRIDLMTFPRPLAEMGAVARDIADAGFDGVLFTEGGRTAYLSAAITATAAPSLELSTGVAVAFPRSPMVTAQVAWELHEATGGKFRLGLGTQVRTHAVRRYASPFDPPGPRMRDYVLAVKASFASFAGEPLDHHGPYSELTFMNRQWSPGPLPVAAPKVDIAAVNTWDGLADALRTKYTGLATRLVFYNAIQERERSPERFRRYGEVARQLSS